MILLLKRFALFASVWITLTGKLDDAFALDYLLVGAATAAAAAHLSLRLLPASLATRLGVLAALRLAPGFLWGSFKAGFDVARRAFHPSTPLNPGWLRHETHLPPGPARVSFGSEISLMPGTLAAGGDGGTLLVHCLDIDEKAARSVASEEARLARSIGLRSSDG